MLTGHLKILRQSAILVFPVISFGLLFYLTRSDAFGHSKELFSALISVDLLITIPLIFFLLIRKTRLPNTIVIPVLIMGLFIGKKMLPSDQLYILESFQTYALPVLEISIFSFLIFYIRKELRQINKRQDAGKDFFDLLQIKIKAMFPSRLATFLTMEIAVFYYGFFLWRKPEQTRTSFTYHRESGAKALYFILIFLIIIETGVIHLLLSKVSVLFAWILSGISLYTLIQIFGFLRSLSKRPIIISENTLILRYGIMKEARIDPGQVKNVMAYSGDLDKFEQPEHLSLLKDFEAYNVIIELNSAATISGPYGIKKNFKTLALFVDNKERFINSISIRK